jgi:tryptophan synthase beta subunit
MIIKVCGLTDNASSREVADLPDVNYVGFIFYEGSKRFTQETFATSKKKVGVFVNAPLEYIAQQILEHKLDAVQLHGDESPEFIRQLPINIIKIKAFGIASESDLLATRPYDGLADYFLFDTKSESHGGTGTSFNWKVLESYEGSTPFLLSGGIGLESVEKLKQFKHPQLAGYDLNSRFELSPKVKDANLIATFIKLLNMKTTSYLDTDALGFYGEFGGAYVPELLRPNVEELDDAFNSYCFTEAFEKEFKQLLKDYVGRPTPLYLAGRLSEKYGATIYLKREDLCHTGAHKVNNTVGQILLAKHMGKTNIIAETGAGQHGVATATVCALMGLNCIVYMGEKDIERQAPNVQRMKMLGAEVRPASSGSKTLKDATNEAIRHWINHPDSYYLIGSVVGPHPYPKIVAYFQSVISKEIEKQLLEKTGKTYPDKIIACVGGGSNAAGAFYQFYDNPEVELVAVEAAGHGVNSGKSAATSVLGTPGVLHGSLTLLMQDADGQVTEPHSISAGLDYPGIGPLHAHTIATGRAISVAVTDDEALQAALELSQLEGIIPALESAHALYALNKLELKREDVIVVNLSGRGDKDMNTYLEKFPNL